MNNININNLVELFYRKFSEKKKDKLEKDENNFLKSLKKEDEEIKDLTSFPKSYSWEMVEIRIRILTYHLKKIIKKGDRCILLSENRPEWLISDIAIMNSGGVTVPLFTTYSKNDYDYIFNDCKPKICIVSNKNQFEKIKGLINDNIYLISIETFDKNIISLPEILNKYLLGANDNSEISGIYNNEIKRNDLACIIYTSGTTGNPKGVMLSHGGILSNCEGALDLLVPLTKKAKPIFLTWLPLSHSYEHTVQFVQISLGAKIYYAESLDKLISNMSEAKPTIMTAVPRFYQNLFTKISMNFSKQTGIKRRLINLTLFLGIKNLKGEKLKLSEKILNYLSERLVRNKIRNQFGGNLQAFVSGGGALDQKIGEFLNAVGLPTLQGYGLTEASPVVSCNIPGKIQVKTVGPPFKTNKVRIADDGEILIKGENVMLGYWNKKSETDEVIKNGWLHTGDIGQINKDGNLEITDRKKEIIVNLGGDNISPTKIENLLCLNQNIKQSFVYGDKKNYLVALIVCEKDASEQNIKEFVDNLNKSLSIIEKIKKFIIIDNEFTIENRMLTPTLKLKRKIILENYKKELENLY